MRRYVGSLVYVGVMLCAGPLAATEPVDTEQAAAVQRAAAISNGFSDEAIMVLAGTALIGLAAAVRRAA